MRFFYPMIVLLILPSAATRSYGEEVGWAFIEFVDFGLVLRTHASNSHSKPDEAWKVLANTEFPSKLGAHTQGGFLLIRPDDSNPRLRTLKGRLRVGTTFTRPVNCDSLRLVKIDRTRDGVSTTRWKIHPEDFARLSEIRWAPRRADRESSRNHAEAPVPAPK
jgi:hypothetical protein